ncbi:ferrous iron transport protein B [Thermococcus thermotolerans]|uniref:ferrous iron transport protein B n=1 Tax=Thermococcus thermotolerans TaxID=2969672 RepID=UPI002157ED6A|nr:ferrous iron transport protein B [Thermococcus thermotolerans]
MRFHLLIGKGGKKGQKETSGSSCSCHGDVREDISRLPTIALVGNPNVGKSVLFNALTGKYVTVSNYPGTTVDISTGRTTIEGKEFGVIDTPGMYSLLLPITEEEEISRKILLEARPDIVVHVVDAKNLERMLPLTLQLMEAELNVILVLNLMDEAKRYGVSIDIEKLSRILGIPVIGTVAVEGKNIDKLKKAIVNYQKAGPRITILQDDDIEAGISEIMAIYGCSRAEAILALISPNKFAKMPVAMDVAGRLSSKYKTPIEYRIVSRYYKTAEEIARGVIKKEEVKGATFGEKLSALTMNPITGLPVFLVVLYGFYLFVGVFGAQMLVDFIEGTIFEQHINPYVNSLFEALIPWLVIQDLFVHEYGIITLGIRYAVAIILPIVGTFFLAFSILEDSGYLPRLAMLVDRVFKKIGLNGRAVIPIVLGFGCDTMATIVTRTLETRRERTIATFLLALAIPCSAQLGVILALLSGNPRALALWILVDAMILLLIGWLAAKIMPGEKPQFFIEIPPLRVPKLSNVLVKTWARMEWYFKEVLPIFVLASVMIWLGRITGLFDAVVNLISYPVTWIGLPKETSVAFLFGFFRRDYGAAGLYDLADAGVLSGVPLLVSAVVLTLFVPCIAQFSVMWKERGPKMALSVLVFNVTFAFTVGAVLAAILNALGVIL